MWTGHWASTLVAPQIAHGRLSVQEVKDDKALIKVMFIGDYRCESVVCFQVEQTELQQSVFEVEEEFKGVVYCYRSTHVYGATGGKTDYMRGRYQVTSIDSASKNSVIIDEGWYNVIRQSNSKLEQNMFIEQKAYDNEWHGHCASHLEIVYAGLKYQQFNRFVWLAGDSSFDSKHWVRDEPLVAAVNGYHCIMSPPVRRPDVCHWLNFELKLRGSENVHKTAALNTAVEESTLNERLTKSRYMSFDLSQSHLTEYMYWSSDRFICDHINIDDTLVVSIGGNDIALHPTATTIAHMAALLATPMFLINYQYHPSFTYFVRMFKDDVTTYIKKLINKKIPRRIIVCMIYYPCTDQAQQSWANAVLTLTGYNIIPSKLQAIIRAIYEEATCKIKINGTEVKSLALFDVLDHKDQGDYNNRVEPSSQGGHKMAKAIASLVLAE